MSFILDALKKSELERQRQIVPGLMDSRAARGRTGLPRWAIGLMLLLGINLTVLTVMLTRSGLHARGGPPALAPPSAAPQSAAPLPDARLPATPGADAPQGIAPRPPAAAAPTPAAADHFSPLDGAAAAPVYAPEIPVTAGEGRAALSPPAVPAEQSLGSSGHEAHRRDLPPSTRDEKPDDEVLPSISEINTGGQDSMPDLHLDVHVYATDPADRFVYINMHKYREGSTLAEGPTVERIRRDGVVLDYHGLRFVLPRQR